MNFVYRVRKEGAALYGLWGLASLVAIVVGAMNDSDFIMVSGLVLLVASIYRFDKYAVEFVGFRKGAEQCK